MMMMMMMMIIVHYILGNRSAPVFGLYFNTLRVQVFSVLLTAHPCIILYIKPTWCTIFLSMFLSFLYMFRATMCPSSGETPIFMRHLVLVHKYQVSY